MAGYLTQAFDAYNSARDASLRRRQALQALSMEEMRYQQAQQAQQREQQAAAANFGALTAIPGALPGAQPMPQGAGPAPGAPQPQGPQPPMPGQPSVPRPPMAGGAQSPSPVGAQPGGTGVPPAVPSPAQPSGGPAPSASLSAPGAGSPGAGGGQPQLSQPADMLRQMAMELRRANPGIDPMTAMEAIKQRVDLMKGLEPDLKNQISWMADQIRFNIQSEDLMRKWSSTQDSNARRDLQDQLTQLQIEHFGESKDKDKWQLMTDPEHQDEAGKTIPATQYWASAPGPGKPPQYMSMSGEPYTPAGAAKLGGGGAAGGTGGRESVLLQRIINGANEAVGDLENISELPIGAHLPFWSGAEGGTITNLGKNALLNNFVTSQEAQDYGATASGLQRNLAAIESSGLAPPGSLSGAMDKLLSISGDSYLTELRKMGEMRQIVVNGLEPLLDNPRIASAQKDGIRKIIERTKKAVPWTVHDVNQLERSKDPKKTISDFAKQEGVAEAPTVTTQEQYDALPSGAEYIEDGQRYRKP